MWSMKVVLMRCSHTRLCMSLQSSTSPCYGSFSTGVRCPRMFSTLESPPKSVPLEEQTLPLFHRKRYYPVRIGHLLNDKYRIISKLGYGAYSTVWLAKNQETEKFVCLKVCIQDDSSSSPILNEVKMLRHLGEHAKVDHPGLDFMRLATDIFEIPGESGQHYCIVSKPAGGSLRQLQERVVDAKVPKILAKSFIHRLLFAVNFIHFRCWAVHTDISPLNVLMELEDDTDCRELEEQELEDPSNPIMIDSYPVYPSRRMQIGLNGIPILTDFGQMRDAEPMNNEWLMPDLYRAPEVLLGLPWSYPVDIWSLGVMMLELLEGKNLFDPIDRENSQYVLPLALAQYISYLGPPPLSLIKQSPIFATYFDEQGNWRGEVPIPKASFEDFVTTIPPGDEKTQFLQLMRGMLTWDPEARLTANEAIMDKWLMTPVDDFL